MVTEGSKLINLFKRVIEITKPEVNDKVYFDNGLAANIVKQSKVDPYTITVMDWGGLPCPDIAPVSVVDLSTVVETLGNVNALDGVSKARKNKPKNHSSGKKKLKVCSYDKL